MAFRRLLSGLLMRQYFIHSQMYADWGFQNYLSACAHEFEDGKGHAT